MSTSEEFLRRFGIDCGQDLEVTAAKLGLSIREIDANSFDGALLRIRGTPRGFIVLNKRLVAEPGRRRFTIAHEIGHYVHPDQQEAISPCGSV